MKFLILSVLACLMIPHSYGCPEDHIFKDQDRSKYHEFYLLGVDVISPYRTHFEIILNKELTATEFESCFKEKAYHVHGKIVHVRMPLNDSLKISGSNYIAYIGNVPGSPTGRVCTIEHK